MKNLLAMFLFLMLSITLIVPTSHLLAHCQIPCGIYGDEMRIDTISEHLTTIEKSMNEIIRLSREGEKNYNQIVRWVVNKEKHAEEIDYIITYYFMAQRIKPADAADTDAYKKYLEELTLLHRMLVYTMKCKQTTDTSNIEKVRELLKIFEKLYFKGRSAKHKH